MREAVEPFAEDAEKGLTNRRYSFTGPSEGVNKGAPSTASKDGGR